MALSKNCDYSKLVTGVRRIQNSNLSDLKQEDYVAQIIRAVGLSYDPRRLYGEDNRFMNASRFGLWQVPAQLAKSLVVLSKQELNTVIDIGTFKGWTTTILAAYLKMFNPQLQTLTIDPVKHVEGYPLWDKLNISYEQTTSEQYRGACFDLCFIDGDHSYQSVKGDFDNVGQYANVCVLHDINEELCPDVGVFWKELKDLKNSSWKASEILDHSEGAQVMGIGILERKNEGHFDRVRPL
ncbi:class I SAM-dependent methyltransferase [Oligoflexia bacterium]|nr:class I SAM-dependent methyltransferase [Oligoflexia bacterium]